VREYTGFVWKEASLRIACGRPDLVIREVKRQRGLLDAYIRRHPEFRSALVPIALLSDAPPIAARMARAAGLCCVGPMAAVAGAVAEMAAEAAVSAGAREAIVENGGDIFLSSPEEVLVGLYAGDHPLSGRLALRLSPLAMPVSVCSSSSRFGHSLSFGDCDLATIVARDGALADAAATLAGNCVRSAEDIEPALERIMAIPGVRGVLLVKEDRVGIAGDLPPLVRVEDPGFMDKARH
jgi:ApbE superfamily uncharacterized protein (UPF0280 family)